MAAGSSTSSSNTSTSQTLSFAPGMAATLPRQNGVADISALVDALAPASRHTFLQPPPSIPAASLQVVKDTLDAFAGQISDEQLQLLKQANKNKKRKRGDESIEVLKIRKVHLDGFETGQVWQQARRIIQSTLGHAEEALGDLVDREQVVVDDEGSSGEDEMSDPDGGESELGSEVDIDDADGAESLLDEDEDDLGEHGLGSEEMGDEALSDSLELGEADDAEEGESELDEPSKFYEEDPNGLNDGFFSIDDFNKQSQWFEEQDARGDPNTDAVSDDEDIDWTADPLAAPSGGGADNPRSKHANDGDEEDDIDGAPQEDSDEEDGPTFGDMDLNAPEGESEDEEDMEERDDEGPESNANDIFYKDFFAPPPRKGSHKDKKKSARSGPKPIADDDVERAMADVRRDLFDDESDHGEDSEDALSDVSAGDPRSRRSAHERRQAKLAEEIRKLEAASVAKREWTLAGEAAAVDRPVNSLLEQDLDFEHAGKPVPVITQEVTDSIEELVKRRILAQDFNEILRRRPDADSVATSTRRGLIEIDDAKSGKGLADVYEEEFQKNADPEGYVSKSDEKLRREEAEVQRMWKDLSATLDALSSWHYRPRPSAPSLTVVADAPTIAMEDAQPTTAQGVAGGESSLAPQEVYKAGADKGSVDKGEVVAKSGLPTARGEMSREEKQRRRRREKERVRKAGGADANGKKPVSRRAQMQKETAADLKKGGVKVINKKGEVVDMAGNKARPETKVSSNSLKL